MHWFLFRVHMMAVMVIMMMGRETLAWHLAHFPAILGRKRVVAQPSWSACNACIGQEVSIFIGFEVSPLFHISYLYLYLLAWLWCIGQ